MSDWLKLLPLELSQIDNFVEPDTDMDSGDNYVGELTTELKKLFTLWRRLMEAAARTKIDYQFSKPEDRGRLRAKGLELEAKAKALEVIFWVCLQDEYQLWDRSNIGVRRDYKVVWGERSPGFGFMDRFFGPQVE